MSKGEVTRQQILDRALALASETGLEGLSIGSLAKEVGMSKSGLFAHFESKENLQLQVLETAAARFIEARAHPGAARAARRAAG
ncbi:MAG: TetR/AcrR family transcriptional regulator, partial [Thermoanaerobaculia bacterium]|nr:TetR/AcrR family transcriptional regulator [Thermoanaerobaculia bacterium]